MKKTTASMLGKIDGIIEELEAAQQSELEMAEESKLKLRGVFTPYTRVINQATAIRQFLENIGQRVDAWIQAKFNQCNEKNMGIIKEIDEHKEASERAARVAEKMRELTK